MAGDTTARGYGTSHQRLRAAWAPVVATGTVPCWRCEELIPAAEVFHLGHDDQRVTRGPEHRLCNLRAAAAKTNGTGTTLTSSEPWTTDSPAPDDDRRVLLIFGPPGAGKSTLAAVSGLAVFDRDDPHWLEHDFPQALARIGRDPHAQAAVVRTGATPAARRATVDLVRPTETQLLLTPAATCVQRITARRRTPPSLRTQIAAAHDWWRRYQPDPDGEAHTAATSALGMSEDW